jgi:hypothetical protein
MAKTTVVDREDLEEQAEDAQPALAARRAAVADAAQDTVSQARPAWEQLQAAIGSLTEAALHGAREVFARSGAADAAGQVDGATADQLREAAQAGVQRAKERLGPRAQDVAAKMGEQAERWQPKAADLQRQARERAADLTGQARERTAEIADRARDQASDLSERAAELAERASERAGDLGKQAKGWLIPAAALLAEKAATAASKKDELAEKAATVASRKDELAAHRDDLADQARDLAADLGGQALEKVSAIQEQAGPAVQHAASETAAAIGDAFDATGRAVRSTINNIFWIIVLGGLAVLLYAPKDEEREKLFAEVREWVTYAIDLISELRGGK